MTSCTVGRPLHLAATSLVALAASGLAACGAPDTTTGVERSAETHTTVSAQTRRGRGVARRVDVVDANDAQAPVDMQAARSVVTRPAYTSVVR